MRIFLRCFILIFILLVVSSACQALTLPEALDTAEQHPSLKLHGLNIVARELEIVDAAAKGPSSLDISTENFGGKSGFDELETTIEFSVPLQNNRVVKAKKALAQAQVGLSHLEKGATRWLIMSQVSRAFHRALVMTSLVAEARENIDNARKLLDAAKIMHESGSVAEQEVFQAELVLQHSELEQQTLQGELEDAKAELITAMGLETIEEFELVGSITTELEIPDFETLRGIIASSHPDLAMRENERTRTHARLNLLRAESQPGWSLIAGAKHARENGSNDFIIGISAELPDSRATRGERAALKKDAERIELEKANLLRELSLNLQSELQRFRRLQSQTARLRDQIVPGAMHLFELALAGYQLGKTDQIVVLQAQKEYLSQKQSYLQKLDELYQSVAAIETLTGFQRRSAASESK
ncbi:MAG TPA: TolC family protein [Candidatus Rifleibacterium sp.]|nr:TolC family protein [Candidatus Rifleibacterium sp.]